MERGDPPLSALGKSRGLERPVPSGAKTRLRLGVNRFANCQGLQCGGRAKKSVPTAESLGRSRGGFYTKLHAVVDALGNCLRLMLTPGLPGRLHAVTGVAGGLTPCAWGRRGRQSLRYQRRAGHHCRPPRRARYSAQSQLQRPPRLRPQPVH